MPSLISNVKHGVIDICLSYVYVTTMPIGNNYKQLLNLQLQQWNFIFSNSLSYYINIDNISVIHFTIVTLISIKFVICLM